ncbi:sensor histidine kinase [Haloparvum sp. AD34]
MYHIRVHDASLLAELLGQWSLLLLVVVFGATTYYGFRLVESDRSRDVIGIRAGIGYGLAGLASGGYSFHQYLTPEANVAFDVILFQATFVGLVGGVAGAVGGLEKARRDRTMAELAETTRELDATRAELEESVDQLEESNDRLEQFAYAASHDLQEPLRMVASYLQLIEQQYGDELDEEGKEYLEYATDGAERMKTMIEGLLDYSRVEMDGDPFEPVDLGEIADDVREDLQVQIEEADATVEVGDLPTVRGDPDQLRQLLQNLVSNGIKYNGDDPPHVEVLAERQGEHAVVSVSDDGIGIDPDDQGRVFEVFKRLHTRDEYDGAGVGLALCERIAERHGGEITVDSEPGEGTTFHVRLPVANSGS